MRAVEAQSRKGRKGVVADRLANTAVLGVLSRRLGVEIKRYKDPGSSTGDMRAGRGFVDSDKNDKDTGTIIMSGF